MNGAQYDRLSLTQLKKVKNSLEKIKKDLVVISQKLTENSSDLEKTTKVLHNVGLAKLSDTTHNAGTDADWAAGNAWQAVEGIKKELQKITQEIKRKT